MKETGIAFLAVLLLLATRDGGVEAGSGTDHHPGRTHAQHEEEHHRGAEHHHGDADDHHETPDSPCHHHDDHTCCAAGPALALPNAPPAADAPTLSALSLPALEPRQTPSARELLHVPLA